MIEWVLLFYELNSKTSLNHAPFNYYPTEQSCRDDFALWRGIAPEWYMECKPITVGDKGKDK